MTVPAVNPIADNRTNDIGDDEDGLRPTNANDRVVSEARKRWRRCKDWQGNADTWWLEDTKFANADTRNRWQWPQHLFTARDDEDRPCLTLNITRIHNRIVINEALKDKSSIKIRPTGGKASYEASQVMQAIIRRVEYISKADVAYRTAITHQVEGGIGYVKIETDYVSDKSFDQDIYIRRCRDPLAIYIDPDCREPDGSDANFAIEFERMSKEKFRVKYPQWADKVGRSSLGNDEQWFDKDHIQVALYHRRTQTDDTLVSYLEPQSGQRIIKQASEIRKESGQEILKGLLEQIENGEIDGKTRKVKRQDVEWFVIAGDMVVDSGDWAGQYIPYIRCVGEETVIEGKLDRKGLTRVQIDANRMLNYNASGQIEFGALQSKTPWAGAADAFEGHEQWKDANRKNYSFLQFNHMDSEGNPIPGEALPRRIEPPSPSNVYAQGMADAERQCMMSTGQFQAQLGEEDQQSAASGKAINARQKQGDTATYLFSDHQADMWRHIGVQLLDLIPKIYDTERTLHILDDDGTKRWIKIDPTSDVAMQELKKESEEAAEVAFNPAVGEYESMADVGPSYATQRQEAWNALSQILVQNTELTGVIGDLLFRNGDFPVSDEAAERLKSEIKATKPYLFNENADPATQSLQMQVQKLSSLNGELMQKLAEMQLKLRGRDERRDIDAYNADTNRTKVQLDILTKILLTPAQKAQMEHELLAATHQHVYNQIEAANEAQIASSSQPAKANGTAT